jgi:hypothetical protein
MKFTPKPTELQNESTKNCPYCGSEITHYLEDVYDKKDDEIREEWVCDKQNCGKHWQRKI